MLHRIPALALVSLGPLMLLPAAGSAQAPAAEVQVRSALLAAPESQREEATVLGYGPSGDLVTLRQGSNQLICLADDPGDQAFSVACYHESLEPYMARGRELRAAGVTDGAERNRVRWKEADEGTLAMPGAPATLFVFSGSGYDEAGNAVTDPSLRYVIYTPWATLEDTGLPDRPAGPGGPWLMFPGTAGAHIMISPPAPSGG